jgi:HEAT repeat
MLPYVPLLLPELQKALLDPLPEVRATAARAMGCLLRGMGPSALGELLPWLLDTLSSDGSSVERSGAAQAWHMRIAGTGIVAAAVLLLHLWICSLHYIALHVMMHACNAHRRCCH